MQKHFTQDFSFSKRLENQFPRRTQLTTLQVNHEIKTLLWSIVVHKKIDHLLLFDANYHRETNKCKAAIHKNINFLSMEKGVQMEDHEKGGGKCLLLGNSILFSFKKMVSTCKV